MIFQLMYIFVFFGYVLGGMIGLLPLTEQIGIPDFFRYMMFGFGFCLLFVGILIVQSRAKKTGVIHLLEFGKPGTINWFYVYKDGSIKITPSVREVEGLLYSKELDAQVQEMKSYRIFDHSIRFVPEGIGHAVDLGMCLYASFLKSKKGFSNIREARTTAFGSKSRPVEGREVLGRGGQIGQAQR